MGYKYCCLLDREVHHSFFAYVETFKNGSSTLVGCYRRFGTTYWSHPQGYSSMKRTTTSQCCVKSQQKEDFVYTEAEG
jgi:hypothetical protein